MIGSALKLSLVVSLVSTILVAVAATIAAMSAVRIDILALRRAIIPSPKTAAGARCSRKGRG